ncbi:potassium-transporting ATPase subunit F [Dactylosporangium sp. AC04546]|nr:potassium-transporting ATPase subunit F [Dactylosporangium sp. AC04546]WVK89677.1 potassium-transporting ATPase subunit F [Dactylosporangium sp. AC04546]
MLAAGLIAYLLAALLFPERL